MWMLLLMSPVPMLDVAAQECVTEYEGPAIGQVVSLVPQNVLYRAVVTGPGGGSVHRTLAYRGHPTRELFEFAVRDSTTSAPGVVQSVFSVWVDKEGHSVTVGNVRLDVLTTSPLTARVRLIVSCRSVVRTRSG